jgi:hypothetical protein
VVRARLLRALRVTFWTSFVAAVMGSWCGAEWDGIAGRIAAVTIALLVVVRWLPLRRRAGELRPRFVG